MIKKFRARDDMLTRLWLRTRRPGRHGDVDHVARRRLLRSCELTRLTMTNDRPPPPTRSTLREHLTTCSQVIKNAKPRWVGASTSPELKLYANVQADKRAYPPIISGSRNDGNRDGFFQCICVLLVRIVCTKRSHRVSLPVQFPFPILCHLFGDLLVVDDLCVSSW